MPTAAVIGYVPVAAPIREAVSKFGGQPVWLEAPQWPVSRSLGVPMQFVCQVNLDDVPGLRAAVSTPARMAYFFITDPPDVMNFNYNTFEPEGGENAVILQPAGSDPAVAILPQAEGPSLLRRDAAVQDFVPVECAVEFSPQEEPDWPEFRDGAGRLGVCRDHIDTGKGEEADDALREQLDAPKLGGVPSFFQEVEFPDDGPWHQVAQLPNSDEPFILVIGYLGTGHVFLSGDGRRACFLSQCA